MKVVGFLLLLITSTCFAQPGPYVIRGNVRDSLNQPLPGASISLTDATDSILLTTVASKEDGSFSVSTDNALPFLLRITHSSYQPHMRRIEKSGSGLELGIIQLSARNAVLDAVTVTGKKPAIEFHPDKTVVNVDASLSNVGATALEVLEKSPGVSTDKDGNLSLNGRPNVLVMVDNKPTYLSPADLTNMLSSMNASQVEAIELITNPSSRYDAAGTSGIINLRLKKNKTRGFNGSAAISFAQGFYPKQNNNLQLNYRAGKVNLFLNYSFNINKGFGELYALRKYYQPDEKTITGMLEQPAVFKTSNTSHILRTGLDYSISKRTSAAVTLSGQQTDRSSVNWSTASWMNASQVVDSVIATSSHNNGFFENAGVNLNIRHSLPNNAEITADADLLNYRLGNNQSFENKLSGPNAYNEYITGSLPSTLKISSVKTDYSRPIKDVGKLEAGAKISSIRTDNFASYFLLDGNTWKPDYQKTNHFIYNERIRAVYASLSRDILNWSLTGGLRYENTRYDATQKDNPTRSDSAFKNNYSSFFPTATISYKLDSSNSFSLTAGRRIDRPPFQKLNPFIFIINKYTYQQGNPFILPQYSWNIELNHNYKDVFVTTISYSLVKNYFSQVFHSDPGTGLIIYSEGNLGRMRNLGIGVSSTFNITSWWSTTLQGSINDKKIEGFVWDQRTVSLATFYLNGNNQFRFGSGWSGELSGFFHTSEQELQEITDPTGQLAVGVGKQVLKNKGTVKLTARDIFYTQAMKGNTLFRQASEYFKFTRDSRVVTLAFSYRFGKSIQSRKISNAATEEMNRAAGGN